MNKKLFIYAFILAIIAYNFFRTYKIEPLNNIVVPLTAIKKNDIPENIVEIDEAFTSNNKYKLSQLLDEFNIKNKGKVKLYLNIETYKSVSIKNVKRVSATINNFNEKTKSIVLFYKYDTSSEMNNYNSKNNYISIEYIKNNNLWELSSAVSSNFIFKTEKN